MITSIDYSNTTCSTISTLECLIAVHVRLFFFQNFGRMYGLIRHCMSIYTRITEFITYKKPKIITVCITILSYLYVKYALLQACMFKNSLKQLCLYVYMDCTAIKHSRVFSNLLYLTNGWTLKNNKYCFITSSISVFEFSASKYYILRSKD